MKDLLFDNLNNQNIEIYTTTTSGEGTKTLETPIISIDTIEVINPAPIDIIHRQIKSALALDLNCFSRFHRINPLAKIPINKNKQATSKEKLLLLVNAWKWGTTPLS